MAKPSGVQAIPAAILKALIDDVLGAAAQVTAGVPLAPFVINAVKTLFDDYSDQIMKVLEGWGWVTP